jgi:hypothetical protein
MPKIGRRLDASHGGDPDPRIVDVAGKDGRHLLPQELVDPISPLRHNVSEPALARPDRTGEGEAEKRSERTSGA